eukprot:TRINITY_DN1555_c0_g1_i5.p1 TRINITY_DN1555_c0_g1~~TRINITY_DN1555_c0_g1_i5.p1  ORF type:complete len:123 (-),score=34.81 TRINITY_DN1555_c0_g1_i5:209-577(-)
MFLTDFFFFFFFSSRRRHTRCREVSWARRCVQETGINAEYMGIYQMREMIPERKICSNMIEENKEEDVHCELCKSRGVQSLAQTLHRGNSQKKLLQALLFVCDAWWKSIQKRKNFAQLLFRI